ncbi:PadR family transcriptional regulator [Nocardia sp. NPDC057030]|uniref:PadR family transcriptional regulator n=1 Tax=unclassified Nocardia TaxID=2637762 RepID=UPI00363F0EFA
MMIRPLLDYIQRRRYTRTMVAVDKVVDALTERPHARHSAFAIAHRTGLRTWRVFRVLDRMLADKWLRDGWEPATDPKRPPRRYYELTDAGRDALGVPTGPRCREGATNSRDEDASD